RPTAPSSPKPGPAGSDDPTRNRRRVAEADLDPGGLRTRPGRARARSRDHAAARHHVARRRGVDEPRRLAQQGGRVRPRGPAPFDDRSALLRWNEGRDGRHLELGISEMNLFLLLGQLGLAGEMFGEPLIPIGTVYDPFVLRGLDAFVYGT